MSKPSVRRSVLCTAVLIASVLVLAAAGAPQGGAGTATIKFRAIASDGSPVSGLTPDDVAVKVEGQPREIVSLTFVDLRSAGSAGTARPALDPPFTTNAASTAAGRDIYILVDEESIAAGRDAAVKEAASVLLESLVPGDRAALVSVRQGGPNVGLTREREKVRSVIASLGGYANTRETAVDLTCRTSRTIQVLQGLFNGIDPGGAPPLVVFLSTGVAGLQSGKTARIGRAEGSDADLCLIQTEHYQRLGAAAQNASVTFYALELLDASASSRLPEATGGLEDLAGATSGEFARLGANLKEQMARVAQAAAAYYVATFKADAADRGGSKRLEVTVSRGGTDVKAPRELTLASAGGKRGSPPTPRDMIRVATPFTDLPLRGAAYSSRNPGDDKIRVLALFEPLEPATKFRAATIVMYDNSGKGIAQWNAQSSDFAGPTTVAALVAPPGEYRLRVAATDTAGRAGTVDIQMTAALIEAGPIHLGELVLGRMSGDVPTPVMQFQAGDPEALAMIELYGRPAGPLTAFVEVLDKPDGEALQAVPLSPSATSEKDKFVLAAKIPLTDLKPGDYIVRAVVGVQGQEGKVARTLRKLGS